MRKLISYFTAALTAITMGVLSFGTAAQAQPAAAARNAILLDVNTASDLRQNVQYYPERRSGNWNRHGHGPRWDQRRPQYRPHYRPYHRPYYRPHYQQQYRYYRPAPPRHYRPAPVYRSGHQTHINWCYNRYRSYRASDNTFQPNYGPRRQCYSPYI